MNVTPVSAPGLVSTSGVAKEEAPRSTATASDREQMLRRQARPAEETGNQVTAAIADTDRGSAEDRQKAEQLRAFIGSNSVRLNTYHDEASGRSILEVRDQTTGNVVTQYPSEELIRLYSALRQSLVDQSA